MVNCAGKAVHAPLLRMQPKTHFDVGLWRLRGWGGKNGLNRFIPDSARSWKVTVSCAARAVHAPPLRVQPKTHFDVGPRELKGGGFLERLKPV